MRLLFLLIVLPLTIFSQPHDNNAPRYVAFTFDDLPSTHDADAKYIIERLTKKLQRHSVPAIGFVNEIKLYRGGKPSKAQITLLELWLNSGLDLGNHSYSHISIDNVTLDDIR